MPAPGGAHRHTRVESTGAGAEGTGGSWVEGRRDRGGSLSFGCNAFLIGEKTIELPTSYIAKNHQLLAPTFCKDGCLNPGSRQVPCRLRNCCFQGEFHALTHCVLYIVLTSVVWSQTGTHLDLGQQEPQAGFRSLPLRLPFPLRFIAWLWRTPGPAPCWASCLHLGLLDPLLVTRLEGGRESRG